MKTTRITPGRWGYFTKESLAAYLTRHPESSPELRYDERMQCFRLQERETIATPGTTPSRPAGTIDKAVGIFQADGTRAIAFAFALSTTKNSTELRRNGSLSGIQRCLLCGSVGTRGWICPYCLR
jgi:hypothetical protein